MFATAADLSLGTRVYDTQSGVKVLRDCPEVHAAVAQAFESEWAFDVILLEKLLHEVEGTKGLPVDALMEVPLVAWHWLGLRRLRTS